ncbi:hypothetical protein ACFS6H_20015 [Terrimonas rubra]|uniref:Uncharacterized protein n=1 Tax=Terrimonas rubra TaxID=1035890 RepID=A0ABW6AB55_9BACT
MTIEEIENNYHKELLDRRDDAKNFKGQVAGRHPDQLSNIEINAKVQGFIECYRLFESSFFDIDYMKRAFLVGVILGENEPGGNKLDAFNVLIKSIKKHCSNDLPNNQSH